MLIELHCRRSPRLRGSVDQDSHRVQFPNFLNVKEALAGRTLTDSTFGAEWGRTAKTVSKDDHANAFSKWLDRCKNVCGSVETMSRNSRKSKALSFIFDF